MDSPRSVASFNGRRALLSKASRYTLQATLNSNPQTRWRDQATTLRTRPRGRARVLDLQYALREPIPKACGLPHVAPWRLVEIDYTLDFGDHAGAMIFDCWTPKRYRGLGYFSLAIRLAASALGKTGENVFIFSAATNTPSIRGILKAGFSYSFSLVRQRNVGLSGIIRRDQTNAIAHSVGTSARSFALSHKKAPNGVEVE